MTGRPLSGRCILVTRPEEQAHGLRDRMVELGAEVLVQPAVTISDPPDWPAVDAVLARLDCYDWLVFSSSNGVRSMLDRLVQLGGGAAQWKDCQPMSMSEQADPHVRRRQEFLKTALRWLKLAAIGPGTAAELERYGLRADVVPAEYRGEALADVLAPEAAGKRFLLARANRGRQVLPERLVAAGAAVEQIVVYTTADVRQAERGIAAALASGCVDWVTVTSSAIARAVVGMFGKDLRRTRLASISPLTSQVLGELGYPPAIEARQYTMAGLVEAIVEATDESRS